MSIQVSVTGRGIAVFVGAEQDGVDETDSDYCQPNYDHSVVGIPGVQGRTRPSHVDDSQDAIRERRQIDRPRPDAQAKRAAWFPAPGARNQSCQDNHLEGDVDAGGAGYDDRLNHFLEEQTCDRNEGRHNSGKQQDILLVGVAGLVIILDRLWWLSRTRSSPGLVGRVLVGVSAGADVAPLLAVPRTPLHRVLAAGVASLAQPRPAREAALEQALLAEQPALERGLSLLAVLAATAPLLGLLGTVTGMIGMFQTIAGHGAGNLRLLSGSISIALVTTQFGLLTAVPLLLSHAWLARVVEHRQTLLEEAASGFLGQEREARP